MQAFILAAGKGTRLLPYTNYIPKPLFPVLNKPILEKILEDCIKSGIKRIGINLYHLKHKIKKFLSEFQKKFPLLEIVIFEEPELLGTGGALVNAAEFFKEPTIVINADIFTNLDFKWLKKMHFKNAAPISMVLISLKGGVLVDENGFIQAFRVKHKMENTFFYTGIQVINPDVISYFFREKDLIKIYEVLIKKGIKIAAIKADNFYFKDIGTIQNYLKIHEELLKSLNPFFDLSNLKGVTFKDWVCIGRNVKIQKGSILERCVVWDYTSLSKGHYKDSILTPYE